MDHLMSVPWLIDLKRFYCVPRSPIKLDVGRRVVHGFPMGPISKYTHRCIEMCLQHCVAWWCGHGDHRRTVCWWRQRVPCCLMTSRALTRLPPPWVALGCSPGGASLACICWRDRPHRAPHLPGRLPADCRPTAGRARAGHVTTDRRDAPGEDGDN